MFSSVRTRLTLWYAAVMTGVLIALAFSTYIILYKNAIRRTDAVAVEQADSFLKTVDAEVHDASGPETLKEALSAAISEHRFRDTLFFVLGESGEILASSVDFSEGLRDSLRQIERDQRTLHTARFGKRTYRAYLRPFSAERKDCTLIVLQSLHP